MIDKPSQIADDIHAALRGDPRITDPALIAVSVDSIGTVALAGSVRTLHADHIYVKVAHRRVALPGYAGYRSESAAAAENVARLKCVLTVTDHIGAR
jgi:osmotically-inducible protein OsmY